MGKRNATPRFKRKKTRPPLQQHSWGALYECILDGHSFVNVRNVSWSHAKMRPDVTVGENRVPISPFICILRCPVAISRLYKILDSFSLLHIASPC